ncbi:MAG: hypothetical protein QOF97_3433 [Acidimicrobiaceae bacterium]
MESADARRLWRALEPYHGMIYFVPEGGEEYAAVGLEPGRMGYFASRSAPLGPVPADVVIATFFNFHPDLVRSVIPAAWTLASPESILAARLRAVDRSLRRLLGDDVVEGEDLAEAAGLARTAAEGCIPAGRPLYAAHASLPWPADAHLALWHAVSLLREFRGDGHIAALVANGIDPLTALVLHGGTGDVPVHLLRATRQWPDDEWEARADELRADGVLDGDGMLTEQGRALRQRVEDTTDAIALAPWEHLGPDGCARLRELGKGLSKMVLAAGAIPGR